MRKHAYLIMIHGNIQNFYYLLELLDYKKNDIYVHVDLKFKEFDEIEATKYVTYSNLFFIERTDVKWGGDTQLFAEINLFKAANDNKENYSYYHLLSGEDLPLHDPKSNYDYFEKKYPKEFVLMDSFEKYSVEISDIPIMDDKFLERIKYYHPFISMDFSSKSMRSRLDRAFNLLQKWVGINRIKNSNIIFQKGMNWGSFSDNFVNKLLNPEYQKFISQYFSYGAYVDEMYKQTLIVNDNDLKNNIFSKSKYGSGRLVIWENKKPKIFSREDFYSLYGTSQYRFARKFDKVIKNESSLEKELR